MCGGVDFTQAGRSLQQSTTQELVTSRLFRHGAILVRWPTISWLNTVHQPLFLPCPAASLFYVLLRCKLRPGLPLLQRATQRHVISVGLSQLLGKLWFERQPENAV